MEELKVTGKIIKIMPAQSGTSSRGEWTRQEFVIETDEQYPKKICIGNFNNRVDLKSVQVGSVVSCSVNIESREFNEKWYTNVTAWKMDVMGANANVGNAQAANEPVFPQNEQPFNGGNNSAAAQSDNDLPF